MANPDLEICVSMTFRHSVGQKQSKDPVALDISEQQKEEAVGIHS